MKVTADTITDEQIRELLLNGDPTFSRLTIDERAACAGALGLMFRDLAAARKRELRARCADAWNARHGADS